MRRLAALITLAAALTACGSTGASVTGTWQEQQNIRIPGAKLVLVLDDNDGVVTGLGSYTIEAGRTGTLQVSGTFHDPDVSLALAYDFGDTVAFSGTLKTATRIEGHFGGDTTGPPAVFNKQ